LASEILSTEHAWRDYLFWQQTDRRKVNRINELIRDAVRSPSQGLGKLEPLRHELQGCWSRRIDTEHRLVYEVREGQIRIIACRYHYR
jgi:toxin YoeB